MDYSLLVFHVIILCILYFLVILAWFKTKK